MRKIGSYINNTNWKDYLYFIDYWDKCLKDNEDKDEVD